jgi:hypothetical protein
MKKAVLFLLVIFLTSFASIISEAQGIISPFEGEWIVDFTTYSGEKKMAKYIFTGNKFEYYEGELYEFGTFSYRSKQITFRNENPENKANYPVWSFTYELISYTRIKFTASDGNVFRYTKQPYFDIQYRLRTDEGYRTNFPVNQMELTSIQGSWKNTTRGFQEATYTFSGNDFTLTAKGSTPVSGTVKINDNILVLIVDNKVFGCYIYEFQPKNILFLHELFGDIIGGSYSYWGSFKKQ